MNILSTRRNEGDDSGERWIWVARFVCSLEFVLDFFIFFYIEEVGRLSGSFGCISFSPDVDGAYCPHE